MNDTLAAPAVDATDAIDRPHDVALLGRLHAAHVATLERGYAAALAEQGLAGCLVHAGAPRRKSVFDDQDWPFRPTPPYRHWLPLETPDCALLVVPGKKPTLFLNVARGFWESPPPPETDHFWSAF